LVIAYKVQQSGGLSDIIEKLSNVESILPGLLDVISAQTIGLVREGFSSGSDPYGTPWQPLVCDTRSPLYRTGDLARSFKETDRNSNSVTIGSTNRYAKTHQDSKTIRAKNAEYLHFKCGGAWVKKKKVTIPARPMLPTKGLPPKWETTLLHGMEAVVMEYLNGE